MNRLNQQKLRGLSLTAAVQICAHPEIAVIVGGSESRRNPIDVISAIIADTFTAGLNYLKVDHARKVVEEVCWICHKPKGQLPDRCPGHYDMSTVGGAGLDPLDIRCVCGHLWQNHYAKATGEGGECRGCECEKFNSGYTDEAPHA